MLKNNHTRVYYSHSNYSQYKYLGAMVPVRTTFGERIVEIGNEKVLVVQVSKPSGSKPINYVIVPGYIESKEGDVYTVRPIRNEKDKSDLIAKITDSVQGSIRLW